MKIVIDIPDRVYDMVKRDNTISNGINDTITCSILGGTVLPEGNGDLIDRDALIKKQCIPNHGFELVGLNDLNVAPVIIPADKGQCFDCKFKTDSCQEGLHCIRDEG